MIGETATVRMPARSRIAAALRWSAMAVITALLLGPLVLWAVGARMLVVEGGSMAPTYRVGDVLIVTAPTGHDLVVGEPVVIGDGDERYVHRVVDVDGDRARLRGDANTAGDPGWITQDAVSGVVAAHIIAPAAIVVVAATSLEGRIALVLVLALLAVLPWLTGRDRPRVARATYLRKETA